MEFFTLYSWMEGRAASPRGNGEGLSRFIEHYAVGMIAFMLSGKCRYSQHHTGFPNIFLVNVHEADESRGYPVEHAHTYWLKWLLVSFINARRNDERVSPTRLVKLFANQSGDSQSSAGGYDERLIRACLGSLSEASVSNVVRKQYAPRRRLDLHVRSLSLTERGSHCMDHIFDSFYYLQLIVDDYMLPIPRCLRDEFVYQGGSDYSYLVSPDSEYARLAREMITVKARQVMLFLECLELSLEQERSIYGPVFDRLERDEIELPDLGNMRARIEGELRSLNRVYKGDLLDVEKLKQVCSEQRPIIETQLAEAYQCGKRVDSARA